MKIVKRILMCRPDHFRVNYSINPWMQGKAPIDKSLAVKQWENLKSTLEKCGAKIEVMSGAPEVPDLVFTANAALVHGQKVYLSNFKHEERKPERKYNEEWFRNNDYQIFGDEELDFEGAGEALFAGNKLFAAHGFRTNPRVYERIKESFGLTDTILCELIDPWYYHLDVCFCPLNEKLAIWNPYSFSKETRLKMENEIELIEVPKNEAANFACNTVVVGQSVILPKGNVETARKMEKLGIDTHQVDISEFLKSGGACKCLTLALN